MLNKVGIEWKSSGAVGRKFVRIRGFLKVHQTNKKFMHMQLGAVKGTFNVNLMISRSAYLVYGGMVKVLTVRVGRLSPGVLYLRP